MRRIRLICGVDEAGRGPLCGPVVAAAVILDPARPIADLADSKKLSEKKREALALLIRERAVAWAVADASVEEIDRLNILHASLLAMSRAVEALSVRPDEAWVDGNCRPHLQIPAYAIVDGDNLEPAISAASILAKTVRDGLMRALDLVHPGYGLADHKGYATQAHLEALRRNGVATCYRKSFAPVRALLDNATLWPDQDF
jgi:ribonuclease HII